MPVTESLLYLFLLTCDHSEAMSASRPLGTSGSNRKQDQYQSDHKTPEWLGCTLSSRMHQYLLGADQTSGGAKAPTGWCPGLTDSWTVIRSCPSGDSSSSYLISYPLGQVLFYKENLVCGLNCSLGGQHFPQSHVPWLWLMFLNQYLIFICQIPAGAPIQPVCHSVISVRKIGTS